MKILAIIPAYNEEEIIIDLVKEFKTNTKNIDYIVINDASTDRTKQLLKLNNIIHINLPVNAGLTGATRIGMAYAYDNDYDYAIKIDGDGQHDPKAIHYMLQTMINNNCDVVQMSRYKTKKKPFFSLRMMGSRLISFCSWLTTGQFLSDPTNGCHLYNKTLIKEYHRDPNLGPEPDTLCYLMKNKYKLKNIQFDVRDRKTGVSKFALSSSIMYMLEICTILLFVLPFRPTPHKRKVKQQMRHDKKTKAGK